MFLRNIFGKNIFSEKNIFNLLVHSSLPLHTIPILSQYLLFEVEGGGQTNEGLTDGTHTHIVSFIVLDNVSHPARE